MNIKKCLSIGAVTLSLSSAAFSNGYVQTDSWAPGPYIGLQVGYGMTNLDSENDMMNYIANALNNELGLDYEFIFKSDDVNAFAGRVYVGYDVHKNFAIEVGYARFFNKPSFTLTEPDNQIYGTYGNTLAVDLMGVIKANIVGNLGLFAKLGANYLQTNWDKTNEEGWFEDFHNISVAYGAGAYYNITKNVSMDISWMRYNGHQELDNDYQPYSDLFLVGIKYKFSS